MENDTDKLIKQQLETLPRDLQRAIASVPWKTLVEQIGKENGLSDSQIEILERETMFVIYGFEPIASYTESIMREISISGDIGLKIANSVGEKILDYISSQAEIFGKEKKMPTAPKPPITTVPEIKPDTHPMIEPRPSLEATAGKAEEKAHEVPHTEENKPESRSLEEIKKKLTEQPKVVHYTDGKDPYREPIE